MHDGVSRARVLGCGGGEACYPVSVTYSALHVCISHTSHLSVAHWADSILAEVLLAAQVYNYLA